MERIKDISVSTRSLKIFGIIWAIIFVLLAHKFEGLRGFFGFVAFLCFFVAIVFPWFYLSSGIYRNWIRFGDFIGKINSFIIITVLFYGIFSPVALVLRFLGKDLLSKKIDKAANSYFISRKIQPGSMVNQF